MRDTTAPGKNEQRKTCSSIVNAEGDDAQGDIQSNASSWYCGFESSRTRFATPHSVCARTVAKEQHSLVRDGGIIVSRPFNFYLARRSELLLPQKTVELG
jgi:hypothetical protein